jgi:hypothetical protein
MSDRRPTPIIAEPGKKICPFCGKPSYSAAGVHPQCAAQQADAARQKLRKTKKTPAAEKPQRRSWQKKCPKCGIEIHIRKRVCTCGNKFGG